MKRYTKKIVFILGLVFLLASCEQLQGLLSSEMEKVVSESTGKASIASKYWYYNGTKDTDMTKSIEVGTDYYESASLLVTFGKKVALQNTNPAGSIELTYTGNDGLIATKTIPEITGSFTSDFTGYKVNMAPILTYFDTETIPSGTASMEIKISGFVCAEGSQNGRTIPTLIHKMTIMPLFSNYDVNFSTCWYKEGDYVGFQLNGNASVPAKSLVSQEGLQFAISSKESEIIFTPEENLFEREGNATFYLENILPETCGDAYSREITLNFVKDAIVIDGKEDLNYRGDRATCIQDDAGDQNAFASLGYDVSANADITQVSVVNDTNNLYVGVVGNLSFTWNDGLVLMIAKAGAKKVDMALYSAASTESLKRGSDKPFAYLYHKPGNENSGSGKWAVYSSSTGTTKEITENCDANPKGWTETTTGTFLEYALPLADLGLSAEDTISIIACASLHWDDGNAVCDIVPNDGLTEKYTNTDKTEVMYDFSKGLQYIIQ